MKCPNCQNSILQKAGKAGEVRFRIVEKSLKKAEDGTIRASCWWCKTEVVLPLQFTSALHRYVVFEPPA